MSTIVPDELHRLIKLVIDTGEAESIEHAQRIFDGYRIGIAVGPEIQWSISHQAALLTFLQLASRVFLGGVDVALLVDTSVPNLISETLSIAEMIKKVNARIVRSLDHLIPAVYIGTVGAQYSVSFAVRVVFSGWRAGICPADMAVPFEFGVEFPLAGALAAALAVNEAFLFVRKDTPEAGLRNIGVSLWRMDAVEDWWEVQNDGPEIVYLPTKLWLIGLGHLGQAYLWGLMLLPYKRPSDVLLVLQDIDTVTTSTLSTSILSEQSMIGQRKTRAMASVLEARGFQTEIVERRFDEFLHIQPDDPQIALCGLDNALGRRSLYAVGFKFVVEAGLGRGTKDFRAIRIHTFPGAKDPRELWKNVEEPTVSASARAYDDMRARGIDQCGVTMLAGKSVGAPFVGVTAAAFSLAEILRILHEGPIFTVHDIDLKSPHARISIKRSGDFAFFNPGFSPVHSQ
ncbi:MAG: ThiF family adenylyltransferase [Leptospirillum sp.]